MLSRRDVIRQAKGLALATPFLSLIACDGGGGGRTAPIVGATMGTTFKIDMAGPPPDLDRAALEREVASILEAVNAQMSTYRPDSELSRFNAGPAREWARISDDTRAVVEAALAVSRLSAGAFDATVGPLVDLWGFGAGSERQAVPAGARLAMTRRRVGYDSVRAERSPSRLAKGRAGLRLDLGGIAKGFAVDRIAEHLERLGVEHYLVEIGGELRGRGYSPRGELWRIGIERPVAVPRAIQRVVRLGGQGLATSGDYRVFFESEDRRYSHIIDPRNGRPVDHGLASVTVIAASAMAADALSTAFMVLGAKAGGALARREGIAAFFITRRGAGFAEIATPAFAPYLVA